MELALQIGQFILSIAILVTLHELGHFLPAKWFKTKVEKFYLFFDPYFSLIKKKIGETEYGIGWLPFGGYVKIAGMVDESMDKDQLKSEPKPWEFRSKPAWQRLIIMLGGVTVNVLLAWAIFSGLSFFNGETFTDLRKSEKGMSVSEAAKKMGFEDGDKILKIDGKEAHRLENAMLDILFSDEVTVLRKGREVTFPVNEDGVAEVIQQKHTKLYLLPKMPGIVINDFSTDSVAPKFGVKKGDKIMAINGEETAYFEEFSEKLKQNTSRTISLSILRNGKPVELKDIPVNAQGKLGISIGQDVSEIKKLQTHESYSFLASIPRGLERTVSSLTTQIKQFKIIFNTKTQGYKSVGGPIAIVKMMPVDKEDGELGINWVAFWSFTAMFSVWLAFLNLLPIPGLDGGHVIFTLWEIIAGKPAPQKILENAQMIGMFFLFGLMLLIFGSDIFKLITGKL